MVLKIQFKIGILISLLFLSSCNFGNQGAFVELENKDYIAAKQKMREGDFEQALEFFHRVVDSNDYTPESHLELGVIYLQQEGEPVIAIYHFNQYLQQKPDSREAGLVRELILSAKKQFASSLPGNPLKQSVSRMELLETVAALKRQVEQLNQENLKLREHLSGTNDAFRGILSGNDVEIPALVDANSSLVTGSAISVSPDVQGQIDDVIGQSNEEGSSSIPDRYTVQSGDSLYAISMKLYGDAEHIQSIFQANRNVLKSVNDLKPGQVLIIPK